MSAHDYDIVIVGGGLVGASLAVALADSDCRVALVEAVPFSSAQQPSYDDRPTALTLGSQRSLESMGVWPALAAHAQAIRQVHVSEAGRFGVTRLTAADYGFDALGYVVENRLIGQALAARLGTLKNLTLLMPAKFQGLKQLKSKVKLAIEHAGHTIELGARLVIGADGAGSLVRAALSIEHQVTDYAQTAVIANVSPARDPQGVAYERFTPAGPIALLPMAEGRCKLVWTHASASAPARLRQSDEDFLADLQQAFGHRLGEFRKVGARISYPLQRVLSAKSAEGRCLLLGNAVHSLHPVAAQGFNLSLRDVTALVDLLRDAEDPGATDLLSRYEALRKPDQDRVSQLTHGLVRLFSNDIPGLGLARSLGMLGLDLLPPLKRRFALRQMGLSA